MDGIKDSDILISAGTHLTVDEVASIKSDLTSLNIDFVVNGHGAASRFRSYYYEIIVKEENIGTAKKIVEKRRSSTSVESRQCPKCKNPKYNELKKSGIWEKIYYYGTTLVQCRKCKTKYPI
ncbi:MAG TPA: hypothetical protein PK185_09170 [Cyclobacteriaceae bacterium]|nr:hypothetical protein [Cyclobacteriaceae bacterium]